MLDLLKFNITGKNRSGGAFAGVKKDLKGVKGMMASVNDQARRMGRSMRNVGAGMSAGVTAPLAYAGKQMVSLYDAQVQSEKTVAQAITSTGGAAGKTLAELKGLASGLQDVTTYGDEDILRNVTAPLLTFTKVQGDVFDRAQANVLDYATLLKMDLKSASLQVGKALNDPVKGITALSRAGVQFTEAQKDMIKSLVEGGDVAGAQSVILKELETQFKGQAAAAAAAPLGQWKQLSNSIGDVKEQLGEQIVPFLKPLVENVKSAVKWFGDLSPSVKRNVVVFGGLAAAVGPVLGLLGVATLGITTLTTAFAGLTTMLLANPIGLAIAAIAGGAYLIYRNWDGITGWFSDKWASLKASGSDFAAWIAGKFGADQQAARRGFEAVWTGLPSWFLERWVAVRAVFEGGWSGIAAEMATWPGKMLTYGRMVVSSLVVGVKERIAAVVEAVADIWTGIKAELATWPGRMMQAGKDAVLGLISGLKAAPGAVWQAAKDLGSQLIGGTKKELDSNSPSKVFMQIGKDVVDGLAIGVNDNASTAVGAMQGLTQQLTTEAQKSTGMLSNFRQGALGMFKSVLTGAQSFRGAFGQMLGGFGNKLLDTGLNGLFDAIWPFAKGAAFSGGRVTAFAKGGVVNGPTMFPMMGGTGLMGEAGPEAIMPLERGPGGRLGVRAQGGGGGQVVNLHFAPVYNVDNSDAAAIAQLQADNRAMAANFERRLHQALKRGANRRLNNAWQPS